MAEDENGKIIGRECQADGCGRTVDDGVLWRVNPKGQPGVFMCSVHRLVGTSARGSEEDR